MCDKDVNGENTHSRTDTTPFDLNEFFPYQNRRTYAAINACLGEIYANKFELTASEWRVLAIIEREKHITSRDIVIAATIDKVAVSRAVARLEDKNYVKRTSNPDDRRCLVLTLSPAGIELFNKMVPYFLQAEEQILSGLDPESRKTLFKLLKKIEINATGYLRQTNTQPRATSVDS